MKSNPHKSKNLIRMPQRTIERESEMISIEREAIANFSGQLDDLLAALGVLRMGDHFGWRVLVLIHNKRTIRKYEDILNIRVREFFPAEASQSHRSNGYKLATKLNSFWKVVSGDVKIENRRAITESDDEVID